MTWGIWTNQDERGGMAGKGTVGKGEGRHVSHREAVIWRLL